MKKTYFILSLIFVIFVCCTNRLRNEEVVKTIVTEMQEDNPKILPGIYQTQEYLPLLSDKKVAIVSNQTGIINNVHLADTLLSSGVDVVKVFCPEHGFRGTADAGAKVDNTIDEKTGLPIISLYGKNKKPLPEQMQDFDILVFDLQDVGVRFYTYISTLHYVMEACAEANIPVIVLDRPNPNAHYVDGWILDTANCRSFIGMHPVPVVYGMTIGEYGQMINGENWLDNGVKCDLTIIPCKNYTHNSKYSLPVKPSPNLPNDRSIELYPSLCFFEATNLSLGRGTDKQFQIIGHPLLENVEQANFEFTPMPNEGASNPVLNGKKCFGFDLSESNSIFEIKENQLNLDLILKTYELFPEKSEFFKKSNSIELLSGNGEFRKQVESGVSEKEIRESWHDGLESFKRIRDKYLIYE
ncbi:MAG TPA: DUF1343 domain-containing protein [Bacteroidales bacterium]|nr:DUF1343 domain-containing protein [Bacteroidales bacterium]HQB22515.1 DUF1343 domain-containing protein [Bacteroidales bacterium]